MVYTALTNKALKIAYDAHHGQVDCNNVPYIFHPYHLAEQMTNEITTCVALLHDVVEDTQVTMQQLEREFPVQVIEALKLLTHDSDTDYFEYIKAIKNNPVAKVVKLADLLHNSDQSRITDRNAISPEKLEYWDKKYKKALQILKEPN